MTQEFIERLIAEGLTKAQATSVTAETVLRVCMPDDGTMLIKEAYHQVEKMQNMVRDLKNQYDNLTDEIEALGSTFEAVVKAKDQYGEVTDEKARTVISLYGALLEMTKKAGVKGVDAINNAGYIVYAFLGGQARREIVFGSDGETHKKSKTVDYYK